MSVLRDHLMASVRQLVLDHLPYDRSDPAVLECLIAMSASELVARWLNWTWRVPPEVPRQVLMSKEFSSNPALVQNHSDILALIADIEGGASLTKYLSKAVRYGFVTQKDGDKWHRRPDLDLMLNAWGVHHLHFSQEVSEDGFAKRGGSIIFVVFRADRAYLIDVMTHRDWARKHVIQVLVNNWPEEGLVDEVKGVIGLSNSYTDDEALTLRNQGATSLLEIDGKVYLPRGGMTTAGIGIDAVRQADRIIIELEGFATRYDEDPKSIAVLVAGAQFPKRPNFVVSFRPDGYGVFELASSVFFRLGP